MITETRRWAKDMQEWGTREGTKEAAINDVVILNKEGTSIGKIVPGSEVTVRVYFSVYEEINEVHFGVAIFREDGVYCYGTNSKIDGLSVKRLIKGDGYFQISYQKFLLMPGAYYLSVAIWDANEVFAYDYYKCKYKIEVMGGPAFGQLLYLPAAEQRSEECCPRLDYLTDKWNDELRNDLINFEPIKCIDANGAEASVFVTGKDMKVEVNLKMHGRFGNSLTLWLAIYRSDGIYCHGTARRVSAAAMISESFFYPGLRLLPGGYRISVGLWDSEKDNYIIYSHGKHPFDVVSDKLDHGTVYMEHSWAWKLPEAADKNE